MHPFLDVSKLTDEEILTRLGKAHMYLDMQIGLGRESAVHSIKEIIHALDDERHDRLRRNNDSEFTKKFPNSSAPVELGKIE